MTNTRLKNNNLSSILYTLKIGWLYPDLMSTYGDRGNIIVLQKRCEWRGIEAKIEKISVGNDIQRLQTVDFILMGGAEDRQQEIVSKDLKAGKDKILRQLIENKIPGLYICGAYQFLGKYYKEANGNIINGLGIFDVYTENSGSNHTRLIGDIVSQIDPGNPFFNFDSLIGFENHGGRTYLSKNIKPFAQVIRGFGNNGKDQTEGAIYKNSIGTYLHGPLLSKNPKLADCLIKTALTVKYKKEINLEPLDDNLEDSARRVIASRLKLQL